MEEENIYSRVIFKNSDDKQNKDLLNSYNYSGNSPTRYKKWTPDMSFEESQKIK